MNFFFGKVTSYFAELQTIYFSRFSCFKRFIKVPGFVILGNFFVTIRDLRHNNNQFSFKSSRQSDRNL